MSPTDITNIKVCPDFIALDRIVKSKKSAFHTTHGTTEIELTQMKSFIIDAETELAEILSSCGLKKIKLDKMVELVTDQHIKQNVVPVDDLLNGSLDSNGDDADDES